MDIALTVNAFLFDSMFRQDETVDETTMVKVEAINHGFGFNKERLEKHREQIIEILKKMPSQFHKGTGDGWSFLNLCTDKTGSQWGEHIHGESLYALAAGLGMAKFTMPREMWDVLPGGMPYIVFDTQGKLQ